MRPALLPALLLMALAGCGGGGTDGTTASAQSAEDRAALFKTLGANPSSADAAGWVRIAGENESFRLDGTQTVRYGMGSNWVTRTVEGGGDCSNAAFANDPLYGTVKECQIAAGAAVVESGWTRIAAENESFNVSGSQTVRYGSGSSWVSASVAGSGQCSNGYFGNDPLYGTVKRCEVSTTADAAPVSTPSPAPAPTFTPTGGTPAVCTPPIGLVDTAGTAPSVGDGTPGSCTEAALRSALASRDVVTFNCGSAPVTIAISSEIELRTDRNLVLDGGGKVTLDGGGRTRILKLVRLDYRTNDYGLTLQRMTLANGRTAGTGYVAPDPSNKACAYGFAGGSGAAIEVRDARLHVIDSVFRNNAAATPGPDVGGGAIYALGSRDITIVGSTFTGNSGSNAGAVGLLQSNGRFVNSSFDGNSASGTGMNSALAESASCPGVGHPGQAGAGGNAGAIGVDGADDTDLLVCGSRFNGNSANELAGAMGRTPNGTPRRFTIDRSVFSNNRARQAGALYAMNNAPLEILGTTFANNTAVAFGAAQVSGGRLNIVNSTFSGNEASRGVGGALMLQALDGGSVIRNATFAGNKSLAGGGYFSAAIFGETNFPIDNTVFANNLSNDGGSPMQCTFSPGSGSGNLQWPRTHAVGDAPDTPCVAGIAFADPLLGALADNGGFAPTLAPAPSSPLRNAGRNCPATDQLGRPRNPAQCTSGAVE